MAPHKVHFNANMRLAILSDEIATPIPTVQPAQMSHPFFARHIGRVFEIFVGVTCRKETNDNYWRDWWEGVVKIFQGRRR